MAELPIFQSLLFRTSAATDVLSSNNVINIQGLNPVNKNNVTSIKQVKYRAEVVQVATIGSNSYTPIGATLYQVAVFDPNRRVAGSQEQIKYYGYTTPDDVTTLGNAAQQREAIHVAIIAAINADSSNYAVAATLAGGTGFTVTDDGGYYPVHAQSMTRVIFVNTVLTTNGFTADPTITTAGNFSVGVGAKLAQMAAVTDWMNGGNLTSGIPIYPKTLAGLPAVSGQNYDLFVIESLTLAPNETVSGQQVALVNQIQEIYVDNGTGSSTANLTGFLAFERALRKSLTQNYAFDTNSWIDFLDSPTLFQGAAGAVPATTGESKVDTSYGQWVYNNIGTNTITVPTPTNTGLLIDQDLTDTEGAEHTPSLLTNNSQQFVVGEDECSIVVKLTCADHTDATTIVGFRAKAAHAADFNNYTDFAAVGFLGDLIYTWGILNNAATVATNTTAVPVDAAVEELYVKVDISGVVTCKYQNVTYPVYSVGTTPMVFDAGDTIIPTIRTVNISGGDPDVTVSQIIATATKEWLS